MINYFFRDTYEGDLCEQFDAIVRAYPDIRFFQPSPDKAPWHVQAFLDVSDLPEPIELNFWPHKLKGQRRPRKSVEGSAAIHAIIKEAIDDAHGGGDFDLIEDYA